MYPIETIVGSTQPSGICTALEVYRNASKRVTLLHQRSPVLKSRKDAFVGALLRWAAKEGFAQVLLVGSMDAGMRVDSEMDTHVVHLHSPAANPSVSFESSSLLGFVTSSTPAFTPVAPPSLMPQSQAARTGESVQSRAVPPLPGAGIVQRVLLHHAKQADAQVQVPQLAALLMFCGEGDNRGDATALAALICNGLRVEGIKELHEPRSWEGLFGPKHDQALFG